MKERRKMSGIQFVNDMVEDMMVLLTEIESGKLSEEEKQYKTIEMCTIYKYVGSYTDKTTAEKIEQYTR